MKISRTIKMGNNINWQIYQKIKNPVGDKTNKAKEYIIRKAQCQTFDASSRYETLAKIARLHKL